MFQCYNLHLFHIGILTNFKALKKFLEANLDPYEVKFESETDTEAIAKVQIKNLTTI